MMMSRRRFAQAAGAVAAFAPFAAHARAPEIYMDDGGFLGRGWAHANNGFDVVAYHSLEANAEPVKGSEVFSEEFKGETWLFASQENLDAFRADPDRWRPKYGNYCAWAMARNKFAKGDPAVWHIHGGALYLNVSPRFKREWLANIERDIARADANWPGILDRN